MILKTKLLGHVYDFPSVREVMAKANEEKSGDRLAGIAAENAEERVAAKVVLANLTLGDLRNSPAVPYETDEVTRIIQDDVNEKIYAHIRNWTVSELREWILDEKNDGAAIRRISRGLTSEMVAAVAKLMSNMDLIYAARKLRVTATCNTHRRTGDPLRPPPAQPPNRRPRRHHGLPAGGAHLRHRRRGAGAQPGRRLGGERHTGAGTVP